MRFAGPGALADRREAYPRHQPPYAVAEDHDPVPAQIGSDLARPEERVLRERPVDLLRQRQRRRINPDRRDFERRPARSHHLELPADSEIRWARRIMDVLFAGLIYRALVTNTFSTASLPV